MYGQRKSLDESGPSLSNGLTAPSILRSVSPSFKPQRVTTFSPKVEIYEDRRDSRDTASVSITSDDLHGEGDSRRGSGSNTRYVRHLMEVKNRKHIWNLGAL